MSRSLSLPSLILLLGIVVSASHYARASEPQIFASGSDLTPQPEVLVLDRQASAEVFSAAIALRPSIHSRPGSSFTLTFRERPPELDELRQGWRIVAGTDLPLSDAEDWFVSNELSEYGLVAQVMNIVKQEDLWQLELKRIGPEDVIEQGTLRLTVLMRVTSADDDFPWEETFPRQEPPDLAALRPVRLTQGRDWAGCEPGELSARLEKPLRFSDLATVQIRYKATLAMDRTWTFRGGELVDAHLEGRLCQAVELTPTLRVSDPINEKLWQRTRGPFFRMAGWLPVVITVNGELNASLSSSAVLTMQEPIRLQHDAAGALQRHTDGHWTLDSRPSHHSGPHFPPMALVGRLETTIGLRPRMEVILYGSGGPYLEAEASTEAILEPPPPFPTANSLSLTLTGGLTHRTGPWGGWRDTPFATLYNGP